MKFSTTTLIVLASSVTALGSWNDGEGDVTVTVTASRSIQSCPCNGEERVVNPAGRDDDAQPFGRPRRPLEPFGPHFGPPSPGVATQSGPIVVVFSDAGTVTTKTGIVIEIGPTRGPVITRTIWPGPLPSNRWGWNTGVATKTTTIHGPASTDPNNEPWSDWFKPPHTIDSSASTATSTSSGSLSPASSSSVSSPTSSTDGNNGVGPIGGSTSSTLTSSSSTTISTSSTSLSLSTLSTSSTLTSWSGTTISTSSTSSSLSTSSTSSSSNSNNVGPIGGSTSTSQANTFSTSFTTSSTSTSTSSSSSLAASSTSVSTSSSTSSATSVTSTSNISTTSASTTSAATIATATNDVSSLSYIDGILQAHNIHRSNHTAQNLTWSSNLASIAADIAATCYYGHNTTAGGGGYGQNIGAGQTPEQVPAMIGNSMYNTEMPNYPLPYGQDNVDTSKFANWGHFSQIVWRATQEVGCATQQCPNGVQNTQPNVAPYFTVCNYNPPGNIQGAYSQVGATLGQPVVVIIPS